MNDESTFLHLNTIKSIRIIYNKLNQEERQYFKELLFGDPLTKIYFRVTVAYLLIMGIALLWPFDFALIERNNAQWIRDPAGISFRDDGQLISDGPARGLFEHMQKGRGLSIEVWIETDHIGQTGPARIISYSLNSLSRNFTLGQSFDQLIFRLRTTETDLNGTRPHLVVDNVFMGKELLHIVVTYNFSEQLVFVNGELRNKARFLKCNDLHSAWISGSCHISKSIREYRMDFRDLRCSRYIFHLCGRNTSIFFPDPGLVLFRHIR
jgi:hypothetical protein